MYLCLFLSSVNNHYLVHKLNFFQWSCMYTHTNNGVTQCCIFFVPFCCSPSKRRDLLSLVNIIWISIAEIFLMIAASPLWSIATTSMLEFRVTFWWITYRMVWEKENGWIWLYILAKDVQWNLAGEVDQNIYKMIKCTWNCIVNSLASE